MNIVLITPQVVGSKTQIRRVQPPLGIACLAATLLEKGYDNIKIIDAAAGGYDNIVPLDPENKFIKFGLSNDQVIERIKGFNPTIVGISALFSSQAGCALSIARAVKNNFKNAKVILGGVHASKQYEEIMQNKPSVDYIIHGEGDIAFPEFVRRVEKGEPLTDSPGLIYRAGSKKSYLRKI